MEKTVTQIGRGVQITRPVNIVPMTLDEYIKARYKKERSDLTSRARMLINRIEEYIKVMGGTTPRSRQEIIDAQLSFLQTATAILSSPAGDALLVWDLLLFLAYKNEDNLFNTRQACSYYHELKDDRQQPFLGLMTLVVETANVRNRAAFLTNSPITTYTALLSTEEQRANLAAYYATNI